MMSLAEAASFAGIFACATRLAALAGRTTAGLEVVEESSKPPPDGACAGRDAADDSSNVGAGLSRADEPSSGECPARALVERTRWLLASLASASASLAIGVPSAEAT